jgi:replicative superfamily II helicase
MEVARLLANTYGGYLATRNQPEWRDEIEEKINNLLISFIELELVEEENQEVKLTLLGQVCGRSSLQFPSMMRLLNLLKSVNANTLTGEGLAVLIQGLPELDRVATPIAKGGRKENRVIVQTETGWTRQAANKFGHELVYALQKNADDFFAYYARCKRALILSDWISGVSIENIEQQYTVNAFYYAVGYGHIRNIVDTTRFHLRAAHQIASVLFIDHGPDEASIETLLKQLEEGLPSEALALLEIPITLTRGEYLILLKAGISTNGLWKLSFEKIAEILGQDRALQLEKLRLK